MSSSSSGSSSSDDSCVNPFIDAIKDAVSSPSQVTTDEGTVKERAITELIEGAKYIEQRPCRRTKNQGITRQVHKMPGTP